MKRLTTGAFLAIGACALLLVGSAYAQLDDRDNDGVVECCESGDVFCGVGTGRIEQRDPNTGALIRTLDNGSGSSEQTGMCFDAAGNLHSTNFTDGTMSKFDTSSDPLAVPSQCGTVIQHPFAGPFGARPESCVFSGTTGNVFTGEVDAAELIREFDAAGVLQNSWSPLTGPRGVDWLDLAADQSTILYTSEGDTIRTYDTGAGVQGPDFATAADGLVAPCFALRIRPAGGEVLVACSSRVVRLDSSGNFIQQYLASALTPAASYLFALNLDPDGTSFWTADIFTGDVYRVDIASGAQINTFNCPPNVSSVAGLAVCGEQTVSQPDGPCGCMDVALVIDDTGSMGGAIANVITGLNSIIASAQAASGGDLRMSLVTFSDLVQVDQGMTSVIGDVQTAVNALAAGGGGNIPEASDQALRTVVTDASGCGPTGSHGAFRNECVKVAVLVTDADPGGCDDTYTGGIDDVEANTVAGLAAAAGIKIAAVRVGTGAQATILQNYATTTGGAYAEVPGDGSGTSAVIEDIIQACGGQPACGNDVIDLRCTAGDENTLGLPCTVGSDCDSQAGGDGVCEPEECDGADDAACPGRCRPMGDPDGECTCRVCGDGILDPGEQCDNGMGVEICTVGSGDEDNDGLLNCADIEDCPAICSDVDVMCTVDADCPASQNNGKWTFFPDSKCVDGQCWVYCAQDIFCRNNSNIPGSNNNSRCVSARTCDANCQFEEVCDKLGRDPAIIRLREGKPDYIKIHASFPVSADTDPEASGFRFSIYNADGPVYETYMLPGDLVAVNTSRRTFKYKNREARAGNQPPRNGVALVDLRKRERDGQTVMTFRLKAYADLSDATLALMTTQVAVGGEGAALQSLWRKTSSGWKLKQSDLF